MPRSKQEKTEVIPLKPKGGYHKTILHVDLTKCKTNVEQITNEYLGAFFEENPPTAKKIVEKTKS